MPIKAPTKERARSKNEKLRKTVPKNSSRGYRGSKTPYLENEKYERRVAEPRPRGKKRSTRNDFYENPRKLEYRESSRKLRTRRQSQERRLRDDFNRQDKTLGRLVFTFFSNFVFYGVTIGIILMSVMFSFSSKSTASIFGYRFYTVLTNSMVPQDNELDGGFYAGDIVIVKLMDGSKVKKNDIVTFSVGDGSRYLTHRMVERKDELNGEKGDYLITKGDANKSNDPPITADRILGKVVLAVPKVGSILEFVREEFWACLVCILSLYGFFLVLKAYLFSNKEESIGRKRNRQYSSYDR